MLTLLDKIYWIRFSIGVAIAIVIVFIELGKILSLPIIAIVYITSYYILKWRLKDREKLTKRQLAITGLGGYLAAVILFSVILQTVLVAL